MSQHTDQPWLLATTTAGARIWAYIPNVGAVVIATFNTSRSLRDETKKANARRAVACVNFFAGQTRVQSTEEIEELNRRGGFDGYTSAVIFDCGL